MMKQDIKNKEFRENREYVSPNVKVIEVAVQKVLCQSTPNSLEQYEKEDW